MYSNWASRSRCLPLSPVLRFEMAKILQPLQQLGNARGNRFVTYRAKRRPQLVVALGDPSQRSHRIAHRRGLERSLQVHQQRCILCRQPGAAPPLRRTFPPSQPGPASPSDRVRTPFVAREAAAIPPPSPPLPGSIVGLARQANNERFHTGCGMGDSSIIGTI
jgi:hypothetical protein